MRSTSLGNRRWIVACGIASGVLVVLFPAGCQSIRSDPPEANLPKVDLPTHDLVNTAQRKEFVGSEACITCHEAFRGQQTSRHAQTLASTDSKRFHRLFQQKSEFFDGLFNAT